MITITNVPKIPPTVEKLLAIGPKNFKQPKIINKGINKTSAIAINQDEIIGKSEKKSILRIKLRGMLGESIKELSFGKPYSKKTQAKHILIDHSESTTNLVCAIELVALFKMLMQDKL